MLDIFISTVRKSVLPVTLTSLSPTRIITLLPPFGTTCAKDPRVVVSLPSFSNLTFKCSSTSGLNLPPGRSFFSSSLSLSKAFLTPSSSEERSYGSSAAIAASFEVVSSPPRSVFAFFLYGIDVCEKDLMLGQRSVRELRGMQRRCGGWWGAFELQVVNWGFFLDLRSRTNKQQASNTNNLRGWSLSRLWRLAGGDIRGIVYLLSLCTRSFKLAGARFSDHFAGRRSRDINISEA